jgi:hypothetical protein
MPAILLHCNRGGQAPRSTAYPSWNRSRSISTRAPRHSDVRDRWLEAMAGELEEVRCPAGGGVGLPGSGRGFG